MLGRLERDLQFNPFARYKAGTVVELDVCPKGIAKVDGKWSIRAIDWIPHIEPEALDAWAHKLYSESGTLGEEAS